MACGPRDFRFSFLAAKPPRKKSESHNDKSWRMTEFTLITFNCFGIPGPLTQRRLAALATALNASDATVVCLQEVQAHPYRWQLTQGCRTFLHSAFEPHLHAPKGGLLTLARTPIDAVNFTDYHDRGQWYTPAIADITLGKGVLRTRFTIDGQPVIVLNTHLSANYRGDWISDNGYARTERRQLQQLAEIVRVQPFNALVIVCGDFNVPRDSALFREFLLASGLRDPMNEDTRATYRPLPGIPARFALPIDFALVRGPEGATLAAETQIIFGERVMFTPTAQGYLSDHLGLKLQVRVG